MITATCGGRAILAPRAASPWAKASPHLSAEENQVLERSENDLPANLGALAVRNGIALLTPPRYPERHSARLPVLSPGLVLAVLTPGDLDGGGVEGAAGTAAGRMQGDRHQRLDDGALAGQIQ